MAVDYYLKIEGIKGKSTDAKRTGVKRKLVQLLSALLLSTASHAQQPEQAELPPLADNDRVIGPGNFVTNGSYTRIKTTATQYLLCTTVNKRENCGPIVASSTMDGIAVTTSSAPDGTPLVNFRFDPASPRNRANMAYAVARFLARMSVVGEDLEHRTSATAPGTDRATGKCGGMSKLATDTTSNSNDCDTNGGGASPTTDPGNIPDAGTVIVEAYRNPDRLPGTDAHGDPFTPPMFDNAPVVVVPGPRKSDAPIIIPIPAATPSQEEIPTTKVGWRLWDGCIVTPFGITCANAARRNKADPNAVPSAPPPVDGSMDNWWASWWKWPAPDWCKMIGYGCAAKDSKGDIPRQPSMFDKLQACADRYTAAVTYCTEVELPNRGQDAYKECFKNATTLYNGCVQDVGTSTLITDAESMH
jgi:hypothetical protein